MVLIKMRKVLSRLFVFILGLIVGIRIMINLCDKALYEKEERAKKNAYLLKRACNWLRIRQNNISVSEWLKLHGYTEIAIYGLGELGKCLLKELENSDIIIRYIIDRNSAKSADGYIVYSPADELPEVPVIIVTAVYDYDVICQEFKIGKSTQIMSLDKIIQDMEQEGQYAE